MEFEKPAQGQLWHGYSCYRTIFQAALQVKGQEGFDLIGDSKVRDLQEYTLVELIALEEKEYCSGFAIRVQVSYKSSDGQSQRKHMHWFASAINAVDTADEIEYFVVAEKLRSQELQQSLDLAHLFSLFRISASHGIVKIAIKPPKSLCASNLFTGEDYYGSQAIKVQSIRKELSSGNDITLFLKELRAVDVIEDIKSQMKTQIPQGFERRWFDLAKAKFETLQEKTAPYGISTLALRREQLPTGYMERTSFASPEQFLMVIVLALHREHQLDMSEPSEESDLPIRFFEVRHQRDRGRFLLQLPSKSDTEISLQRGDTFRLSPGDEFGDGGIHPCEVEDCRSIPGHTVVIGIIQHRSFTTLEEQNRSSIRYEPQDKFISAKADLGSAFQGDKLQHVHIRLKTSTTTRDFQIQCLELWQMLVASESPKAQLMKNIVLGNRLDLLPKVDILGDFEGVDEAGIEEYLRQVFDTGSSIEQKEAFKLLRSTSGGVFLLDGCAGSGKSRFIRQIILAHLFRKTKNGEYSRIVVPVAQNETGDTIVKRLIADERALREKLNLSRKPIIIRAYKLTAERQILQEDTIVAGKRQGAVRVDNDLVDALQDFTDNRPRIRYRVGGAKVRLKKHSIGWLMGKLLGIVSVETDFPYKDKILRKSSFLDRLINYHNGHKFNPHNEDANLKAEVDFQKDYHQLLKDTLSLVDVLVLTTTQGLDPAYRENFPARLMVFDEASQINDAEFAALQVAYTQATKYVLAGDCKQLGVFSKDRGFNPLLCQWKKSTHQRFRDLGHVTATFYEQHRCTSDIAKLVSHIYYNDLLNPVLETRKRKRAVWIRAFNKRTFDIANNVVFINVPNTTPKTYDTSWFCNETADAVIKLVQRLGVERAGSILTLTPYKEQMHQHIERLSKLAGNFPAYWKDKEEEELQTVSQTFMGIQGAENDIAIVDLTIGERIGFLQDDGQTLVGCSRGSNALYIIGDVEELKKMSYYRTHAIGRLVQYCQDQGLIWNGSL